MSRFALGPDVLSTKVWGHGSATAKESLLPIPLARAVYEPQHLFPPSSADAGMS